MAFCSNCGGPLTEGVRFCPQCGRDMSAAAGPAAQAGPSAPPGATPGATAAGGMTPNVAGLLCYVAGFITGIIFLVLEPYNRDPFVRFHAFQSIFYNVAIFAIAIVLGFIPLGWILYIVLWPAIFVVWVVLMLKAYQNKKWKLPLIGDLAEKQG